MNDEWQIDTPIEGLLIEVEWGAMCDQSKNSGSDRPSKIEIVQTKGEHHGYVSKKYR